MARITKAAVSRGEILWMSVISILIPAMLLIGSLIYVAFYAAGYGIFQKIVIIIVAFIVIGVAEALLWMIWAGRKGLMSWSQPKY